MPLVKKIAYFPEEVNLLIGYLSKCPYKDVMNLIPMLQSGDQVDVMVKELPQSKEDEPKQPEKIKKEPPKKEHKCK